MAGGGCAAAASLMAEGGCKEHPEPFDSSSLKLLRARLTLPELEYFGFSKELILCVSNVE